MNKTITIYDLLGLIKDGKTPKKIKYKNMFYHINIDYGDYESDIEDYRYGDVKEHYYLFEDINIFTYGEETVEILDEEDEFIEITEINTQTFPRHNNSLEKTANKVNQLIHNQKMLIEKMKEMK